MQIKKIVKKVIPMIAREIDCRNYYKAAAKFLKVNPQPKLSLVEKEQIDTFWGEYNIKFPDYTWFEMYYGVTGIHDPRFIPDPVLGRICYPHYNFRSHINGWDDKNVYEVLVLHAKFPKSLCHCINGKLYDGEWNYYSENEICELSNKIYSNLKGKNEIICKKSCESSSGRGVKLLNIGSAEDIEEAIIHQKTKNFILQEKITQHPFFEQFNPTSANIMRIISWRHEGDIIILSATIRFGMKGSFTDIAFVDGKEIVNIVGVDKDGRVKDCFYSFDGRIQNVPQLSDQNVPSWKVLLETIEKAHKDLVFFDFVAWDFMIDANGEPVCIEYNIMWPGTILYQFAHGPLAGEYTDKFLSFLKNAPSSEIPSYFRK